jgi:hypothetical protein
MFLDSVRERQEEEERERRLKDGEEVKGFKEYAPFSSFKTGLTASTGLLLPVQVLLISRRHCRA